MAIASPVIFSSFRIALAGGSGATTYTTHAVEGREITIEEAVVDIDDEQSLLNSYLVSFRITCYDDAVRADARVSFNGNAPVAPAQIAFIGATGAVTMTIDNIRLNGVDQPDANGRRGFTIFGKKRVTTNPIAFS